MASSVWSWPLWSWPGWQALASIGAVLVVGLTAWGLWVANQTARKASEQAKAAVQHANERAERDLYRDLLVGIASDLESAHEISSPQGVDARRRCRGMLTVLPAAAFPLPITRSYLQVRNRPDHAPDPGPDPIDACLGELEIAVARLCNQPVHFTVTLEDRA